MGKGRDKAITGVSKKELGVRGTEALVIRYRENVGRVACSRRNVRKIYIIRSEEGE